MNNISPALPPNHCETEVISKITHHRRKLLRGTAPERNHRHRQQRPAMEAGSVAGSSPTGPACCPSDVELPPLPVQSRAQEPVREASQEQQSRGAETSLPNLNTIDSAECSRQLNVYTPVQNINHTYLAFSLCNLPLRTPYHQQLRSPTAAGCGERAPPLPSERRTADN